MKTRVGIVVSSLLLLGALIAVAQAGRGEARETTSESVYPDDILALSEDDPTAVLSALLFKPEGAQGLNPEGVLTLSSAIVPDDIAALYSGVERLPETADVVRILYTRTDDFQRGTFLGYTIERPVGTPVAFVRYDYSLPWLQWITESFAELDRNSTPEKVKVLSLGLANHEHRIRVRLLQPALGSERGEGDIELDGVRIFTAVVGDHGFLYTSDGHLFIDNLYAGRFDINSELRFGENRLWVDGRPRMLRVPTDDQRKMAFIEPYEEVQEDGSELIETRPWRICVKPLGIGGSNGRTPDGKGWQRTNGMTVLRITADTLYLHGVSFGPVVEGDDIRVIEGSVFVNRILRMPISKTIGVEQDEDGDADDAPK